MLETYFLKIDKDLVFDSNDYGKPVLLAPSEIHFNISHSGSWVVCAIDENPVGIDVEVMKPIDFKIAERFFSRDEYETLMNQPDEMRLKYFYMIWTLKQSCFKEKEKVFGIALDLI
ncbi:MAG: 4'-phosphopantetheinyl transferase superfamily protein [Clostridia bacterium]|nr:4'-phosphopantetheinyl transferase superfamily protein [Clostridia bacterium]